MGPYSRTMFNYTLIKPNLCLANMSVKEGAGLKLKKTLLS